MNPTTDLYFSNVFGVAELDLEKYGAFNVSLVVDLPLFIDPFLLFNSQNLTYQALHTQIIDYLKYLRDQALIGQLNEGRLRALFCFAEVQQNWLGFSQTNNRGRGLGMDFARALADNLNKLFADFGKEKVTHGSHLEKLCLIREGVGRDMISDFTTNLIKRFLCEFTEGFTKKHIEPARCATFSVERVTFHPATGTWAPGKYLLPKYDDNISREEIRELEALFLQIYRKDRRANRLNRQRRHGQFGKIMADLPKRDDAR
jgi:hypothetical protein